MDRNAFEAACRKQNADAATRRADARTSGAPCSIVTMLAFGGTPYCTTHGVMGPCPFGAEVAR